MSSDATFHTNSRAIAWIDHRLPIFSFVHEHLVAYPAPRNLNYMWNFGALAGISLVIMIATGIFLAMHYVATPDKAFDSVEHIMREVQYGWLIRYIHMNMASFFFIVVYIHIFRGLYYGSYKPPREVLWLLGIVILLLMMASAFIGYTLPWGQMSFWGATVITNLFSAVPVFGDEITRWLDAPLSPAYGSYTGRDALEAHCAVVWPESAGAGHRIVLPLAITAEGQLTPEQARPEFYDFNLPDAPEGDLADTNLSDLSFVVFDTETTGLSPRGGDEIVQIAGLRIVNGRILHGETFETLVDPGRSIPAASTRVHHISDDMVRGAPDIAEAGRQFHDFCRGSVLVAHNAPFDLAFLRLKEEVMGRRFDNPVLCTVLMSAGLFDHSGQHTLDALCDRFGVHIPPEARHTAMGDAVATAEVFIRMLSMLEAKGVTTLGAAIAEEGRMTKIRKAQNY